MRSSNSKLKLRETQLYEKSLKSKRCFCAVEAGTSGIPIWKFNVLQYGRHACHNSSLLEGCAAAELWKVIYAILVPPTFWTFLSPRLPGFRPHATLPHILGLKVRQTWNICEFHQGRRARRHTRSTLIGLCIAVKENGERLVCAAGALKQSSRPWKQHPRKFWLLRQVVSCEIGC